MFPCRDARLWALLPHKNVLMRAWIRQLKPTSAYNVKLGLIATAAYLKLVEVANHQDFSAPRVDQSTHTFHESPGTRISICS